MKPNNQKHIPHKTQSKGLEIWEISYPSFKMLAAFISIFAATKNSHLSFLHVFLLRKLDTQSIQMLQLSYSGFNKLKSFFSQVTLTKQLLRAFKLFLPRKMQSQICQESIFHHFSCNKFDGFISKAIISTRFLAIKQSIISPAFNLKSFERIGFGKYPF